MKIRTKPPGSASASASPNTLHGLVFLAMRMQGDRLEHHHFEPFILPPPGFHLPAQWLQQRQRRGRVGLGQVDSGLNDGEIVGLRQGSGCGQVALAKQQKHLAGGHLRHAVHEVVLARGLFGLR